MYLKGSHLHVGPGRDTCGLTVDGGAVATEVHGERQVGQDAQGMDVEKCEGSQEM